MVTITASVGQGGANRKADVEAIQTALNSISPANGGANPKLKVDGWIGSKTIGAILNFQKSNAGLVTDGRVDANGSTLFRINLLLEMKNVPPKPPDPDPKALALSDLPTAVMWAQSALSALAGPDTPAVQTALNVHFHVNNGLFLPAHYIFVIKRNYAAVLAVFAQADAVFRSAALAEAQADRAIDPSGNPFPAYNPVPPQKSIKFTTTFRPWDGASGFGPFCRAAMVLHEPVHYVDPRADSLHDYYEHGSQYDKLTADLAAHNPSSYVSFAQQVFFGWDTRFGAGNPSM
jgi:hypothetical protein